jgi:hypothetical protein
MSLPDNLDRSRMADVADTADGMERATLSRSASIGHFPPRTQSALQEIESVNRAHVVESGRSTEYSRTDSNVVMENFRKLFRAESFRKLSTSLSGNFPKNFLEIFRVYNVVC